jgi:hypothetical protein
VRDAVEVARQIGIDHKGAILGDQPVHFAQRLLAALPGPEAVARRQEHRLKDRFDDELNRGLDDAVPRFREGRLLTVGIPSGRVLPSPLAIPTRRIGCGR